MSEQARRHEFGPKLIRETSRGPVEKELQKRAEWMVESAKVQEYLAPKIKYKDRLAGEVEKGVSVLCLGASKGHEIDEIDAVLPGSKVIGVDPHDYYTRPVRERLENLSHEASYLSEEITAENLEGIPDDSADGITLFFVLHHMSRDNQEKVLEEAGRVLKPDGKVFIAEDLVDDEKEEAMVEQIDRRLNFELAADSPHNYKNIEEWRKLFSQYGFEVTEVNEEKPAKVRHGFFILEKKINKE